MLIGFTHTAVRWVVRDAVCSLYAFGANGFPPDAPNGAQRTPKLFARSRELSNRAGAQGSARAGTAFLARKNTKPRRLTTTEMM